MSADLSAVHESARIPSGMRIEDVLAPQPLAESIREMECRHCWPIDKGYI
jgi:hypothetical protein